MLERLFTMVCVVSSVMFFYSYSHGQPFLHPENSQIQRSQPLSEDAIEILQSLSQAETIEGPSMGCAAGRRLMFTANNSAQTLGDSLEPLLNQLLSQATPAGKLYLASLIRRYDFPRGTELLNALRADSSFVESQAGCLKVHSQMGAIASTLLESDVETIPVGDLR